MSYLYPLHIMTISICCHIYTLNLWYVHHYQQWAPYLYTLHVNVKCVRRKSTFSERRCGGGRVKNQNLILSLFAVVQMSCQRLFIDIQVHTSALGLICASDYIQQYLYTLHVDFLCWLLFRYPFHPRVTAGARKRSRSFCQKCRRQVTAKHTCILHMSI